MPTCIHEDERRERRRRRELHLHATSSARPGPRKRNRNLGSNNRNFGRITQTQVDSSQTNKPSAAPAQNNSDISLCGSIEELLSVKAQVVEVW